MMDISRRTMLRSSSAVTLIAAGAATGQLGSCSGSASTVLPAVLDEIQKAVAAVCPIIPAVTTIIAVIAASFPAAAGVASITTEIAQQIASTVCKLFEQSGAATTNGKLGEAFKTTLAGKEVPLNGFRIVNGKPVWF